jgi:hypothetical protein
MTDDGKPKTRAERSAANKARHKAAREKGIEVGNKILVEHFRDNLKADPPRVITPEMADQIVELVANNYFLVEVAQKMGISTSSIRRKIMEDREFKAQFVQAREASVEFMVERMIMIALGKDEWVKELAVDERKLVLETIKWVAGKILYHTYGDKNHGVNITGLSNSVVQINAQVIDMDLTEEAEDVLLEALENVEYDVVQGE